MHILNRRKKSERFWAAELGFRAWPSWKNGLNGMIPLCFLSKSILQAQTWRLENHNCITIQMSPAIWNDPYGIVLHSWCSRTIVHEVPVPSQSGSPGTVIRNQSKSLPKHHLLNWIMLENRAQVVKTLQIFSYGSANTYSWKLCRQYGLGSVE